MVKNVVELVTAFGGSLGFAMLFGIRSKYWFSVSLGGMLDWFLYLCYLEVNCSPFWACFWATVVISTFSEISAQRRKAPAPLFFVPSIIPLIPGSSLYYAMNGIIEKDLFSVRYHGMQTIRFAMAIAGGMCCVMCGMKLLNLLKKNCGK